MSTWPASLPQTPLQDGFQETFADNLIFTEMDQGPNKVRRRTTSNVTKYAVTFLMTTAQVATFKTFWSDTISNGATSFTFTDPRTGDSGTFRIDASKGTPSISSASGSFYNVSFGLERLP